MDSCSPQLPCINLADKTLSPGSSKWVEVRSDVRKALEEFGCFEASYDKVSWELQESIVKTMAELFALPVETKKRNVCPKPYVGYLNHNDLSESLGIQNANILENVNEFTQQLWPDGDGDESISETIQLFAEKLTEIDVMVRKMVMESYGIEKYIDEHLNSTSYRMRLMKYIAPPDVDADTTAKDNANVSANVSIDGADAADGASGDVKTDGVGSNVGVKVNVSDDVNANDNVKADASDDVNADVGVNGETNVDADADANGDVVANSDVNAGADGGANGDVAADSDANAAGVDGGANGDANISDGGGVNANTDVNVNSNVDVNVGVDVDDDADVKNGATTGNGDHEANDGAHVDDTKLGLPCHTDKNLLTILFQHEIEGLDVKTKDEKWIRVKPSPNTFVVIAGDSLCALMNGRISAPYHRVRVTEKKKTRYTAAIFTCPKPGYLIDAPKELVDEKHPRLFKPFDYRDLFTFYHTEAGRKIESTLQAYCAVSEA